MLSRTTLTWIKRLRHKKYRSQTGSFLVTGHNSVVRFLQASGYSPQYLLTTPKFLARHVALLEPYGSLLTVVSPEMLTGLSPLTKHEDVLLVVRGESMVTSVAGGLVPGLVLDDIVDPGNLGTIIRIAEWYGITHITLSRHSVDGYNPKVIQASVGSLAGVSLCYTSLLPYLKMLVERKIPVIGATLQGENLHEVSLPPHACLLIGNETRGISKELYPYLAYKVRIPGANPRIDSLNAAIAAAIIMDRWCAL